MSSDNANGRSEVPWKPAGVTPAPMFRCGVCDKASTTTGRKLQRVRGLKTWVCKACAIQTLTKPEP